MRLLIKEISYCGECPYLDGFGLCDKKGSLAGMPIKTTISPQCPLDQVRGRKKRMIMEEIKNCKECPYYHKNEHRKGACIVRSDKTGFDAENDIHWSCPLERIDSSPHK